MKAILPYILQHRRVISTGFFKKICLFNVEYFVSDEDNMAGILIDRGAQMEVRNKAGLTPLLRAFDWGNV